MKGIAEPFDSKSVPAFETAARALEFDPSNPDVVQTAVECLVEALNYPSALAQMDRSKKEQCYRSLLLQAECPTRPIVLTREAARHITSGNAGLVKALTAELFPVIEQLLRDTPQIERSFVNVLLFALTTRVFLGDSIDQLWLSDLHVRYFSRFEASDLSLPYSVMFDPESFGQNRNDLVDAYCEPEPVNLDRLGLHHILLLEWLANKNMFPALDNSDLSSCLQKGLEHGYPDSAEQRAAGRMLLMRHWRKDGVLSGERLKALGLDDIMDMAKQSADIRDALPRGHCSRQGAKFLHNRFYQALQAGRQRLFAVAPMLNIQRRKVRVAICVSGQLRGYQAALASWKRNLLPEAEATFFVHSWTKIGNADAKPFRYVLPFSGQNFTQAYREAALAEGYDTMRERYPTLFAKLNSSNLVTAGQLAEDYQTDHVSVEDDKAPEFSSLSNQQKMHYKIHAADCMARHAGEFDLFMRIRPDLSIKLRGFDWRDLLDVSASGPVIFAEKPYGVHYGGLMIGDQCAVASPEVMKIYADTWINFPKYADANLARCPPCFKGHVSLALNCWIAGLDVRRLPVRFDQLEESNQLCNADILNALEADSRQDATDRELINAARRDA